MTMELGFKVFQSFLKIKRNLPSLILILFLGCTVISCTKKEAYFIVSSPDGNSSLRLSDEDGVVTYVLSWRGQELIHRSELSIFPGSSAKITASKIISRDTVWQPVWGQFSEIRDRYNQLMLDVEFEKVEVKLYARIYYQGVGFRYVLEGYEEGVEATLYCEYKLDDQDALYCPNGESTPLGPLSINDLNGGHKQPQLRMPIVVEKQGRPYLSILESDLFSSPGFEVMQLDYNQSEGFLVSSNKTRLTGEKMITPWRVILIGETVGDLVTSTVTVNLSAQSKISDPSWIKPGKTLWDWRVHGYKEPNGFTYGVDTESYLRFIDFAAKKEIEYFLIDDSWYKEVTRGHFELSDKLDLQKVIDYADKKGVDLILYYDRRHGEYGDDALFDYYQSLGMKGIKYGFMKENVSFTRDAIRKSAESHLLIDFHDNPVPFTGIRRTYPNAISREYCHAQQDSRRAFTPETFIKMALINAIQGPLDMNNGNFDLNGINKGERQKGPRKLNSYLSTVTSEAARTLIIFSGLVCMPDAPEAYNQKADLFEFIQKQPVGKWDESHILNAKIGKYITTARRHEKEWFIGSVIDQKGGSLDIILDFLEEDEEYLATFYEDSKETHCKTNPGAYQIRTESVEKGQLINAQLAAGGGHCMWIRPKSKD